MKRILLLLLLAPLATLIMAQEQHGKGSFSPAAGIVRIDEFDIAWESGLTFASDVRTSEDGNVILIGGIGFIIGGYDIRPMGIDEPTIVELKVFPNPVKDLAVVTLEDEINCASIELYTTLGVNLKRIPVQNTRRIQIDLSTLANGIYLLSATDANGRTVGRAKIVVQR